MQVIGMGEEKTPRSFRAACSVFTTLEVLVDQDDAPDAPAMAPPARPAETAMEEEPSRRSGLIHQRVIEADIAAIISENDDKDKPTGLGELGSRLVKKYSDFDVRNYGYSSLSKFLEEMDAFELSKSNSAVTVRLRDRQIPRKELDACAVELVRQNGKSGKMCIRDSPVTPNDGRCLHDIFKNTAGTPGNDPLGGLDPAVFDFIGKTEIDAGVVDLLAAGVLSRLKDLIGVFV